MSERFMKYSDAAEYLQVSESLLRQRVMRKKIPYLKIGKSVRFTESMLDAYAARHRVEAR